MFTSKTECIFDPLLDEFCKFTVFLESLCLAHCKRKKGNACLRNVMLMTMISCHVP